MTGMYEVISSRPRFVEVVGGSETMLSPTTETEALRKWKIKAEKAISMMRCWSI